MSKFSALVARMKCSSERSFKLFLILIVLSLFAAPSFAQQREMRNPDIIIGQLIKVIPSLKDYKTPDGFHAPITRIKDRVVGLNEDNENVQRVQYSKVETPDPVVQSASGSNGPASSNMQSPNPTPSAFNGGIVTQNFAGLPYTNVAPADPNMCAGPTAVIQTINNSSSSYFKIWDLNGNVLLNQTLIVNLVASPGYTGSGDPVAMYDQMADRYLLTEFGHAGAGSGINTLIACVSQTNNPLGAWYIYKFTDNTFFPDYPKWGAMANAYYASTNDFNTAGTAYLGSSIYAFNKTKMLAGDVTAEAQRFRLSFNSFPVNVSGTTAPAAGDLGMFMYYTDDDFTADPNDQDSIGMITFSPNFAVPASTVLTWTQAMKTAPFKSSFCGGRNCVPSASGNGYDGLADRVMNRVIYRKFPTYDAIVLNYTVDANVGLGSPRAGLRWYELRRPNSASPWSIFQQSTYAPCGTDWRWMGSININSKGQIALGYDLSSTSKYASMYFTGRNATDPLNTMTVAETLIQAGTAYGTFGNRWGDYNEVTPDAVNDSLFWMTSMWGAAASQWATRVAQFKLGSCNVESSTFGLTQAVPSVPEGQNIVYTNTVNNTGCVALTNYLMTDTLPTNVTFVSATNGGTYNAGNRVVSWTVNVPAGTSQTYQFTVNINAGAYFAPVTLLNEPVAGPGLPAGWTTSVGVGPNNWVVSSVQSHSAPSSLFGIDNATAITDFRIATSAPIALGAPTSKLTFWHNYNTESGWDGGVVEISTNGGATWVDLGPRMTINGYNNSVGGTNPIAGRPAFSGNSNGWIQTSVDLLPYANQNAMFRFRMTSDDNTAVTGWYVDDINISSVAQVNMRTTLSGAACTAQFKDTVTLILPPVGCQAQTITSQPVNTTACVNTPASFSVTAIGTAPVTYQWQESINGGGTWNNVVNAGIYSGATTNTLNISAVTLAMNGYQYRVLVNGCAAQVTSNVATLTVVALSIGGTVSPANYSFCGSSNSGTFTLSGQIGSVIRWESSIDGGTTWIPIANTTTTLNFSNLSQTTLYRAVVQAAGCATANSSVGTVTVTAGLPMSIVADPGTTVCAGDPTRLTVMEGGGTIPVTVSATADNTTITTNNGVSCGTAVTTSVNSYWRVYPLSTYPAVTGNFTITNVKFGVEIATGGPQNVIVNLYNQTGAAFPGGTRTLIATQTVSVANTPAGGSIVTATFATPATVTNTQTIVIEIQTAGVTNTRYFPGSNTSTESTPSYISAAACAINTPVTYASIGFPNTHIISYLQGTVPGVGTVVTGGTFLWSPAAGLSSTTTNPVAASPAITTTYTVTHNNGAGCIRTAQITVTVNQRPTVTSQPANVTLCSSSSATFTVTGTGTGLTYQWQESTNGGITYTNLLNNPPYSGVTTATLIINPVTVAMSGNRYRVVLSGTCPPGLGNPNISNGAILTVLAQPTVTVTPTVSCGGPGNCNPLTASGANTYTWSPATGLYLDCALAIPYVAGSNANPVFAAPTVNTVYTVTGTNTATGCTNTATATVNYTPAAPTVSPASVTMCLGDAAVPLTITSSLAPTTVGFTSGTINLAVPDNTANGVNHTITVSGIPAGATISDMWITLNMSHTYPGDMIFNLKAPNGQILNLYKYNTGTFTGAVSGVSTWGWYGAQIHQTGTQVFSTVAVAPFIYNTPPNWKADALNTPVAGAVIQDPAGFIPTTTAWAPLQSVPNGGWTLAMCDGGPGDIGSLASWQINFTYGVPSGGTWTPNGAGSGLYTNAAATIIYTGAVAQTVYAQPATSTTYSVTVSTGTCTSAPRLVPVTVNVPVNITAQPVNAVVCTDKVATFSVTATGTAPSYQWQESTNGGVSFTAITNGGVYSGATTSTLTITAPPVSMNGYQYRVAVAGTLPCPTVFSAARTLTVNPLPIVVITASPYTSLLPGLTTTLSSTSTPSAATYTWFRNNAVVAGGATGSYVVDIDHLGDYKLRVVDVNGCVNTSNVISIRDSLSGRVFIYPNPNSGSFQVRYNPVHNATTAYGINIIDAIGKRILTQQYTLGVPYAPMFVNLSNYSTGVYWVEVVDIDGNRLAMGRVEIVR